MARTTKKKPAMTPEEKLEQALVPEAEQPYKVPENWCWTTIDDVLAILNGYAFKSKNYVESGIRIIRIANVQDGYVEDEKPVYYPFNSKDEIKRFLLADNDLLISLTGNVGRVAFLSADLLPAALNQRVGCLRIRDNIPLLIRFLYYFLLRREFQDSCIKNAKGSAQLNMSTEWLKHQPIPLPPLPEHHRIVTRIESLFAKLDEAREKAQAVVDGFEDRKAAILHKAFTGELTEGWRRENGIAKDDWEEKRLANVSVLQTGLMKGKRFKGNTRTMPYLRVANVQDGYLDLSEIKGIEVEESSISRYLLHEGDVLFTEGGDYDKLGRGTVWHNEIPNCLHQNHVFVVRPDIDKLLPKYLSLQAGSNYGKKYFISCSKQTTNLASINSTQLKNFPVILPQITEQKEIVEETVKYISRLQEAKEAAILAIDQIDTMKKSILARAFRGELGTNDPEEESAVELLKRVF